MKTRLLYLSSIIFLLFPTVKAETISLNQARQKAIDFVTNRQHVNKRHAARAAEIDVKVAESQAAFHVFNIGRDDGFVIVGGDDRMPDILGYSDNGHYIADSIPCNMRGWMEGYTEQLTYLKSHPDAMPSSRKVISGESIAPMLECKWSQWSPYNDQCPEGCPTGCVATAMAQIMYYYQWPKQTTKPIPSYTTSSGITIPSIEVTEIDWENMLPTYKSSSPEISKQAVATLMKLCGASIQTNYSPDGSGAYTRVSGRALQKFFNFDSDLKDVIKLSYTKDGWNQIIYRELEKSRPILYWGDTQNKSVGHAFVVDGYDGNNYFHVNWGWGGKYDGYFLLSALELGEDVFTDDNCAFLYLRPYRYYYYVVEDDVLTYYYDGKISHNKANSEELASDDKEKIKKIVISSSFENQEVLSVSKLFKGFRNLETIEGLNYLSTSNVTDMSSMFSECNNLTNLDLSHFDTSNVTDMSGMFSECNNLASLDLSHFDTSNVKYMSSMFSGCSSLTNLDLSNFNTSNVTDMSGMFSDWYNLTSLDLSHFDTSNVKYMSSMFSGCSSLTNLDLSNFDTSNVKYMSSMFSGCSSLTNLDLSNFNTSNVTDMRGMFSGCSSLTNLDLSNFDTSNVEGMSGMFSGCSSLTNLDLSNFDTSNLKVMLDMFSGCSSLTSLDLSCFNTVNVYSGNMKKMFYKCSNLTTIYVSEKWTTKNELRISMFDGCYNIVGGKGTKYIGSGSIYAHIDGGPENPGYFTYRPSDPTSVKMMRDNKEGHNGYKFMLDGRKQKSQQKGKGIYIENGRKVVAM